MSLRVYDHQSSTSDIARGDPAGETHTDDLEDSTWGQKRAA